MVICNGVRWLVVQPSQGSFRVYGLDEVLVVGTCHELILEFACRHQAASVVCVLRQTY